MLVDYPYDYGDILFQVDMPYEVWNRKKTKEDAKMYLNLNGYRNWQGHLNGKLKTTYKEENSYLFEDIKLDYPVDVYFQFRKWDKRIVDKSNVYSVMSKFTYDTMVENQVLPDDSDIYIKEETLLPTVYGLGGGRSYGRFTFVKSDKL